MKKFLSFMLAFVMVFTTFVSIIPPLEVSAATTGASITSLKASSTKVYEGDSVQISGTAKRSGSYYLRAIQINVRNEGDDDHGYRVDRVDFEPSEKKTSYSLSKLDSLEIGSYTCSGCGKKETLGVGKHRIDVSIGVYDSNGNKADTAGITQSIWIEVLEEEAPYVKSISADVDGTEVEFTVKTNLTAKHGIVLYADGYELDMIDWDKDTYSSYIKYTGSHVFNQVGERKITVYALDADGDIVDDSEDTITIEIDSLGQCGAPTITTSNNQEIEVGNSFKISWTKPSSPAGVTFKYNVYLNNGTTNALVAENLTTTSYTIPASKLSKDGTYVISVIAKATDYTQSDDDDASINLTVTEVQENPDLTSVSGSVSGTVATFTVKGNADAKYGIVLYADGYKLDMINWSKSGTSTVTYTGSHTFNQTGTRSIEVYALDKNGNEVSESKVTTTINIVSLGQCGAPSITTANNQKIEVGNGFKISWSKPTTPTGVTFKYNVYLNNGTTNSLVAENLTTTSYTIPASKINKAGTYTISVIAMATDYAQSDDDDASINLTVTEVKEDPKLTSIDKTVNGTVATFTVKGNADAKYGIVLYADGYKLDMISWSKSGTSTVTYTGSHTFNQTGTRNIVVYALDKDGNEVRTSGLYVSTAITINSLGVISAPSITTANNQKIEVGNSFKISWNKPTSPTGVTFKYNVYVWDGKSNVCVNSSAITGTSYTIPASYFAKAGTYAISVIAMATDYTQSDDDDATINLTVTEVQENPDLTSVSGSVTGTVATFTVKGNADAKYGIVLYADGYKLDMISWSKSGSTTYTGSHTFNQTGERSITVYALDKNGNEVSESKVTTTINIVSLGQCGAPSITTANNQKIEVGNSFTISWNKASTPAGVTIKYNVYVWDGKTNTCVNSSPITSTSYTIPASYFAKAGTYAISVIAMATDYTQSDDDDATINLTVTEVKEDPKLTSIDKTISGTVATFTVKGNADAKYGIVLYADGYKLDMINWSKSGTSTVTYTGSHTFNQTGERNITVYALDKDGNEVKTSGAYVSTTITINSLGVISAPSITTANNQKIEVGNSFKISWNKPTSPTGVTFKYNVYVWDGTNNTLVAENLTTTSYTIPASKLNKVGTYAISVIAMATDYTQSDDDDATINLTVTEVKEDPKLTSIDKTISGTVATFTVKGNADAKYGIVLYADGYKLDMINWSKSGTSTVTYTGSHTFNQTGERNITVYALDKDGNEVKTSGAYVSTTITINSLGVISAPSITTANNQKIEVGNSFKISWNKPTSPTGVTFKYNVYVWDGTNNTLVAENLTTTSYTIPASKLNKVGTYAISVIAMATDYTQSDDDDATINLNVVAKETVEKVTLTTPRVSGSSKIQYGDDYTISWDFDAQVDYYQITIDGLNYKKTVNATEKSFTIPGSVFKQYSGADTNYTISLVAMSHDTEKYLPSEAATIRVNVAGYSESNALIKSAEILDGNEIIAGTVVRFKIVTTKDVTALRMKDGAGSFIVNTWYASEIGTNSSNAQYYKDSGNERTWYVQQKVNHAGDANAAGAKRLLTFYSMVNEVEYNNCSVSFYCKKGNDVIGKFEITSPGNNAMLPSGKDIVITWSAPTNTTVDYYIVDVYHGDVRVDRATVTATTYTLSGTLLEKDSVAWQIRVTARKDEGQWAESVATTSFKLECMHEHLGQPTENILSYAQKNDTAHSCVVEKTYACLDCGLANAKKVQETVTKSHNWIALDKGGKVCNQCWHLQSDGSFTAKTDMQLSSLAGNREFVYFNVDASGNPANKQNGRYVDKSDKITILGEVGNCYLIEYPITVNTRASGATNCGFIDSDLIGEPEDHNREPVRSYEQQIVDEFIDKFYDESLPYYEQILVYEFLCANGITEELNKNPSLNFAATTFSQGLTENMVLIFSNIGTSWFGADDYYYQRLFKTFINKVISEIPSDIEASEDISKVESISDETKKITDFLNSTAGEIADDESMLAKVASADKTLEKYFQSAHSSVWFKDLINFKHKDLQKVIDNVLENVPLDKYADVYGYLTGAWLDYITYTKIQVAAGIEHYNLLAEMFPDEKELIYAERDRYLAKSFSLAAYSIQFLQTTTNEVIIETIQKGFLKGVGVAFNAIASKIGAEKISLTLAKVSVVDFVGQIVAKITGLTDYGEGSKTLIFFNYVNRALRVELCNSIKSYLDGNDSIEQANRIIALYDLSRGCQIYINNCALSVTNDVNKKNILSSEINHLKKTDIRNWELNPYYASPKQEKPDLDRFNDTELGYYYKILLDGYSNRDYDGLLGKWDEMSNYEKECCVQEVEALYDFAQGSINQVLILDVGDVYWLPSMQTHKFSQKGLALLFVNQNGEGLIIRYINNIYNGTGADYTSFNVISKDEVDKIIGGNAYLPNEYFAVQRHSRIGFNFAVDKFDNSQNGEQSVIYVNTDKGKNYCGTAYSSYIKLNVSKTQTETIFEHILSYDNYASSCHLKVFDSFISDVWNVWIWKRSDISYIAEKFNARADKIKDESIRVTVVESNWND